VIFLPKNSGAAEQRFCWGFCEKWSLDVVFLWTKRGETRGNRGQGDALNRVTKLMQPFRDFFAWAEMR
jgi:hypothetical protein